MRRLSILLLPCVGVLLLTGLLLKTGLAHAAPAPATETTPGCHWQVVHSPNLKGNAYNELWATSALSTNDVWAVGDGHNGSERSLTEHWNGKSWRIVPSVHPTSSRNGFFGVAAVSTNDVWPLANIILTSQAKH